MKRLLSRRWELGFIKESVDDVLAGSSIHFQMVHNPYKDRWFADPFILNVTDDEVVLLVEEMADDIKKGRIAKLTIDKRTWTITDMQIVLEESTHLSFPAILRENERIYVYPENAGSEKLKLYEWQDGKLSYVQTICDDVVWDSVMTDIFGVRKLFTARQNDNYLDIYSWDLTMKMFTYEQSLVSTEKNMRMAGDLFTIAGKIYCVHQVCNHDYGEAVEIKEILVTDGNNFYQKNVRRVAPPKRNFLICGLHTMNIYQDMIVVDFHVWNSVMAWMVNKLVKCKKTISLWLK